MTGAPLRVMREVVDRVTAQVDPENEPEPGGARETGRRHRSMTLGHAPLKAAR